MFSGNYRSNGGAIYSGGSDSLLAVSQSHFENNSSRESGGALYAISDDVYLRDSIFQSNDAGLYGGGIFTKRGMLLLSFSRLLANEAKEVAGVYADGASVTIVDSVIADNISTESGQQLEFGESELRFLNISDR